MLGMFSSVEMFGYLICCLVFSPMADVHGRKKFTIIGIGLYTLFFGVILLTKNVYIYLAASFVNGIAVGFKGLIMYTLMMEFFPGKESLITGLLFFVDEGIFIWSPLMLVYVTKDTQYLVYISCTLLVLVIIGLLLFRFPESVKFLLAKGSFNEAKVELKYIYKMNKVPE